MPPTSTPSPTTSSAPAPPSPGRRPRLLVGVLAALLVVVGGSLSGWYVSTHLFHHPAEAAEAEDSSIGDAEPPPPALDGARLDEAILAGRYTEALAQLRPTGHAGPTLTPALRYRLALCLEGLGQRDEATHHYRACISTGPPVLQAAAQLGVARASLAGGEPAEAQALLCDLLCRSGEPALRGHPYRAEAACLLGLALALQAQPTSPPSATSPAALAGCRAVWPVERYLPWAEPARGREAGQPAPRPGTVKVAPAAAAPLEGRVTAVLPLTDLGEVLERLAKEARIAPAWGPSARAALTGRRTRVCCLDVPLAELLGWLTLPHGLVYEQQGGKLALRRASGPGRRRQIEQHLRAAAALSGDHPAGGELYLALGNLEAQAGRVPEAIRWYARLEREQPRSGAVVAASYNLGLLRLRQGRRAAARKAFYRAVDHAPGNELAPLCYWWIGRSFLDARDLDRAIQPLRRAGIPAGVPALAVLHLLKDDPQAALDLLHQHRAALRRPELARPANFLDAFARVRQASRASSAPRPTDRDLLIAVLGLRDESWLGLSFLYLRGQALRHLGLNEEMIALYDRGTRGLEGSLVAEMNFLSAEVFFRARDGKRARPRLEALAAADVPPWSRKASLALAELELNDGLPEECLKRCRALLAGDGEDRAAVLALMSRAYSVSRDYDRAAEALAGRVPR